MFHAILWNDDDLAALQGELTVLYEQIAPDIRNAVANAVRQSSASLAERFYSVMLEQPRARFYLDHGVVNERLRGSLEGWLRDLFRREATNARQIVRRQMEIGSVHARIQVPVALVMRGFREVKNGIVNDLQLTRLSRDEMVVAIQFVSTLLDLAMGIMMAAYVGHSERAVRSDEALRLFSVGQDLAADRERQRAALAEWAQTVFFTTQMPGEKPEVQRLGQSEFGLWFFHRADILFGKTPEYEAVGEIVEEMDGLVSALAGGGDLDRPAALRRVKHGVERIGALLGMLFDRLIQSGGAKDPHTRLLSRRFLQTALSHEISLQKTSRHPFSLAMFEIDDFARTRERHGEAVADAIVQQTAMMLFNAARTGDSVFSMGRETFLVLRVESEMEEANRFGRAIADRYAATHFDIGGQSILDNSLSFAVVEYDGHPDPRYLISRVEQALQAAKGVAVQ